MNAQLRLHPARESCWARPALVLLVDLVPARRAAALELLAHAGDAGGRGVVDRHTASGTPVRAWRPRRRRPPGRFPLPHLPRRVGDAVLLARLPRGARPLPRRGSGADDAARNDGDDLAGNFLTLYLGLELLALSLYSMVAMHRTSTPPPKRR